MAALIAQQKVDAVIEQIADTYAKDRATLARVSQRVALGDLASAEEITTQISDLPMRDRAHLIVASALGASVETQPHAWRLLAGVGHDAGFASGDVLATLIRLGRGRGRRAVLARLMRRSGGSGQPAFGMVSDQAGAAEGVGHGGVGA